LGNGAGAWYNPTDITTLFQDESGNIAVTAPGDVVGYMVDITGNGHHAVQVDPAKRPTYRQDANGKGYFEFTDTQYLETPLNQADVHHFESLPSVGGWNWMNRNGVGLYRIGPAVGTAGKIHYFGQGILVFRAITPEELVKFNGTVQAIAMSYQQGLVTNLRKYFQDYIGFTSDLSHFRMQAVADTSFMFAGTDKFTSDLSKWSTDALTTIESMFDGALEFNSNLSNWKMEKVTTIKRAFAATGKFNGTVNTWRFLVLDDMTFSIFQLDRLELNSSAPSNMDSMVVSASVDHLLKSLVNLSVPANMNEVSATACIRK
jgi:hypothetical protein